MKTASFCIALALATCLAFAADPPKSDPNTPSANAAKPPPPKAFINEADAGPDFKIQGEYFGESGDLKLGIQVIALGKEGFEAVVYRDGLPGDGWNGNAPRRVKGKWEGEQVNSPPTTITRWLSKRMANRPSAPTKSRRRWTSKR